MYRYLRVLGVKSLEKEELVETMAKMRVSAPVPVRRRRTKSLAKQNEDRDVSVLIGLLCHGGEKGEELRRLFQTTFPGKEVIGAKREQAGGRSAHYDFMLRVREIGTGKEEWLRVEHKGTAVYKPIPADIPPWSSGVQFFNGGMEKYRLCRKYAEAWYRRFIRSGHLSEEYGLFGVKIPSLEEWIQRDARVQGNPKTEFGRALKKAVREAGKESLLDLRDAFVPDFIQELSEKDKTEFQEDVMPILSHSLSQKDVWLQVAGEVSEEGAFHARWYPSLRVSSVSDVSWESRKDIVGRVHTDCAYPISFILRWGKGAGFSNLRLDLK